MLALLGQLLMTMLLSFCAAVFFAVTTRNALIRGKITTKNGTYSRESDPVSYWYLLLLCLVGVPLFAGLGVWGVVNILGS